MIYTSLLELHRLSWEYDVTQEGCDSSQSCPDTLECLKPRHQRFLSEKLQHVVHNSKPTIDHTIDFQWGSQEGKSTRKDRISLFFLTPNFVGCPALDSLGLSLESCIAASRAVCPREVRLSWLSTACNLTSLRPKCRVLPKGRGEDKGATGEIDTGLSVWMIPEDTWLQKFTNDAWVHNWQEAKPILAEIMDMCIWTRRSR